MNVYTIRNEHGDNVAISYGFIGGDKPDTLQVGEVWVPAGSDAYGKLLKASNRAAGKRFSCSPSKVRTICIGEPA
jgi:hypothetical protein